MDTPSISFHFPLTASCSRKGMQGWYLYFYTLTAALLPSLTKLPMPSPGLKERRGCWQEMLSWAHMRDGVLVFSRNGRCFNILFPTHAPLTSGRCSQYPSYLFSTSYSAGYLPSCLRSACHCVLPESSAEITCYWAEALWGSSFKPTLPLQDTMYLWLVFKERVVSSKCSSALCCYDLLGSLCSSLFVKELIRNHASWPLVSQSHISRIAIVLF